MEELMWMKYSEKAKEKLGSRLFFICWWSIFSLVVAEINLYC